MQPQKQTQWGFLPQQKLILLEELAKKKEIQNKILKQHNVDYWSGMLAVEGGFSSAPMAPPSTTQRLSAKLTHWINTAAVPKGFDQVQTYIVCSDEKLQ